MATPFVRKSIELTSNPARANLVFREVRNDLGEKITILVARYNGSLEDAVQKAKTLTKLMQDSIPQASGKNSRIGAYDADGNAKWTIAPDFHSVAETGSKDASLMWGDIYQSYLHGREVNENIHRR